VYFRQDGVRELQKFDHSFQEFPMNCVTRKPFPQLPFEPRSNCLYCCCIDHIELQVRST